MILPAQNAGCSPIAYRTYWMILDFLYAIIVPFQSRLRKYDGNLLKIKCRTHTRFPQFQQTVFRKLEIKLLCHTHLLDRVVNWCDAVIFFYGCVCSRNLH